MRNWKGDFRLTKGNEGKDLLLCGHFHLAAGLAEREKCCGGDRQTDHRKPCGMGGGWNTRGPVARGKGRAAAGLARYPTVHSFAKESRHIGNPKIGVSWLRARTVAVGDTAIRNSETRALLKADFSLPADKVRLDLARGRNVGESFPACLVKAVLHIDLSIL